MTTPTLTLDDLLMLEEERFIGVVRARGSDGLLELREQTVAAADEALAALRSGQTVADSLVVTILVGLADVVARDLAGVVTDPDLPIAVRLWEQLGERAPAGYSAPPWCLRALAHWQLGDRRAGLADAHRCLEDDPHYTLGLYVMQACRHALPAQGLLGAPQDVRARRKQLAGRGARKAKRQSR